MNIVFMGTPEFAVPSLQRLLSAGYSVAAVATQPDRPKGRKRIPAPPAVKIEALKHGIPVLQPVRLRDPLAVSEVLRYEPDLIVTAAYGQIVPPPILDYPRHGCINVHASLLPRYRGGAPIQHAVINGEPETGVTIMYMARGLDTGDIISQVRLPIEPSDTAGSLFDKLSVAGAGLLIETLPELLAGTIQPVPQNWREATVAPNLTREDERIRWEKTNVEIFNQVRGLCPWPGAFTLWEGEVFKVWSCRPLPEEGRIGERFHTASGAPVRPGTVIGMDEQGMKVMTGGGLLLLTRVQPAGKKAMDAGEFSRGRSVPADLVLGE